MLKINNNYALPILSSYFLWLNQIMKICVTS